MNEGTDHGAKRLRGMRNRLKAGIAALLPVVLKDTVNTAGLPFVTGTVAGIWHVAACGAPLHASDTVPL